MADGSDGISMDGLMLQLVSRMGGMEQAIKQAPTHEKLGQMFNEVRRDFGERFSSSENHVRTLLEKYEADNQQRITTNNLTMQGWVSSAAKAAAKEALAEQRQAETDARASVERNDADVDKRIRNANRNGLGGIVIALLSMGYAVGKSQGWFQ